MAVVVYTIVLAVTSRIMTTAVEHISILNSKPILLLLLIFSLPLLVAFALYYFASELQLSGKNSGIVLAKPIPLHTLHLTDRQGNPFILDKIHARWVLIYLSAGPCLKPCWKKLSALEQIRKALGKDYPRTQVLLLEISEQRQLRQVVETMPAFAAGMIDKEASKRLAEAVVENGASTTPMPEYFLADDKANVMMKYTNPLNQQAVYDDLRWLLKVNKAYTR